MSRLRGVLAAVVIFVAIGNVRSQTTAQTTCAPNQCSASDFPDVLVLDPPASCYQNGDGISLSCPGILGGPDENTCKSSGAWMLPISSCEVFTCAPPVVGANLNVDPGPDPVTNTYAARASIKYVCTQNHALTGASNAVCDGQDDWNPTTVPVCIPSCDPPTIANGGLTSEGPFNNGDNAQVVCDSGYDLAPGSTSTIICQSGGGWSAVPTCYARCTFSGTINSDSTVGETINHGGTKTITCSNGYSYDQQIAFTVTCNNGNLEGVNPHSCYEDCTALSAPGNGTVTGGNMHGETVTFTCNRGYGTNDTTTDICTYGSWNNSITTPTCYAKSSENSIVLFCNPDKYIVEIPGELFGNPTDLATVKLGNCAADYYDGSYLYTNSSYTECDTTSEVNSADRQIIYRNTVISTDSGMITTDSAVKIDVACVFDQDNIVSSTAIIQDSLSRSLQQGGQYDMVFAAYTDDTYAAEITENDRVDPAETIYLRAEVNYVSRVDLFPTRCYATPQPASNYYKYMDLIDEGCSAVTSTYASDLRTDTSTNKNFGFALEVFRFPDSDSDSIYVHCELKICPTETSACPLPDQTTCPGTRRKRATELTVTRHVFAGPIRINQVQASGTGSHTTGEDSWETAALAVYSVTVSAVLLGVVAIVAVVFYRRRSRYMVLKRIGDE